MLTVGAVAGRRRLRLPFWAGFGSPQERQVGPVDAPRLTHCIIRLGSTKVVAGVVGGGEHPTMSSSASWQRIANRAALFVSLFTAVAAGCDSCCVEEPLGSTNTPVCSISAEGKPFIGDDPVTCNDGDDFRFGSCDIGGCSVDADCCPGNRCRSDLNLCFPRLLDAEFECETSADCSDPAQVCATISVGGRDPLPTCIYESCGGDDDCGFGRTCFQNHCVLSPPCNGGCPDGSVCEINTNSCHELPTIPDAIDASCSKPCANGLLVLANERDMTGDTCCELSCVCQNLPPVVPTRIGRYARIIVTGDGVVVSAYDAEFGDLVAVRFTSTGDPAGIDYIDGVPQEPPTGDPLGARGGVRSPGPDVGTHTSIAADAAGLARIAYHDVDNNALKVAIEGPVGVWRSHIVDAAATAAVGQTGTFTDMKLLANGTILVSYLAHNTVLAGVNGPATAVKLARSRVPAPQSAADWELITVDVRAMDATLAEPRGRGLHTNLITDGADVLIGYYDATDGDVRVARVTAANVVTTAIIDGDGEDGRLSGDVGRFPALGIVGTDLIVAYEDPARHTLRMWRGPLGTPGVGGNYAVADQLREPTRSGSRFVGAGARMSTTGSRPVLVYQDASNLDLRFATLEGSTFAPTTALAEGANGFYTDVAVSGNQAFVCSVVAELDQRGKERSRLRLDIQQLP